MAQAAVTQADWTPVDDAALTDLRVAAQRMLTSVAKTGSSKYDANVAAFQTKWNSNKAMIVKALAMANGWTISKATPYFVALKVDGGYGTNTAGALNILLTPGPKAPAKAADVPTYFAKNADFVSNLAPISANASSTPVVVNNNGQQAVPQPSSATSIVDSASTYVPFPADNSSAGGQSTSVVTTKPVTSVDYTEDVPLTVVATKSSNDYKLLAVSVGGLVLGGALFVMLRKKHG